MEVSRTCSSFLIQSLKTSKNETCGINKLYLSGAWLSKYHHDEYSDQYVHEPGMKYNVKVEYFDASEAIKPSFITLATNGIGTYKSKGSPSLLDDRVDINI